MPYQLYLALLIIHPLNILYLSLEVNAILN